METLFAVTGLLFHWKDELAEVSLPLSYFRSLLFLAPAQQCWGMVSHAMAELQKLLG